MTENNPFAAMIQHQMAAQSRANMAAEDYQHRWFEFLRDADADVLVLISDMIGDMKASGPGSLSYYDGQLDATIKARFNLCVGCHQDHEKMGLDQLVGAHPEMTPTPEEVVDEVERRAEAEEPEDGTGGIDPMAEGANERMLDQVREGTVDSDDIIEHLKTSPLTTRPGSTASLNNLELELCRIYGVEDLREAEDNPVLLAFVCNNCQMTYPSLQDRMLKAPDHCSGCIQKSKWG